MSKFLGKYKNGNYYVAIYSDGTKIRYNNLDNLTPQFPECIDLNISNKCSKGCKYCYQNCVPNGKEADIDFLLKVADEMHPFTEVAININEFNIDKILPFLNACRKRNVIVNATFNQDEFIKNNDDLACIQNDDTKGLPLICGIGVSFTEYNDDLLNGINKCQNVVLHTIAGVTKIRDYQKLFDKNLKVLILGYKAKGRGIKFFDSNQDDISNNIYELKKNLKEISKHFEVLSFDNLALVQLDIKNSNIVDNWDDFYMGDDGQYTFYIDAVNQRYYKSSIEINGFKCENKTISEMFEHVKSI